MPGSCRERRFLSRMPWWPSAWWRLQCKGMRSSKTPTRFIPVFLSIPWLNTRHKVSPPARMSDAIFNESCKFSKFAFSTFCILPLITKPNWARHTLHNLTWVNLTVLKPDAVYWESLTGKEASTATSSLHPTDQRCWFHASHQSAHSAGTSCRLSPFEALQVYFLAVAACRWSVIWLDDCWVTAERGTICRIWLGFPRPCGMSWVKVESR